MEQIKLRTFLTDAIRFWEPARLFYNLMLLIILLTYVGINGGWALIGKSEFVFNVLVLAVMANIAYSFAYIPDFALRFSLLSSATKRAGRWGILVVGFILAFIFCRYTSDELVRAYVWMIES